MIFNAQLVKMTLQYGNFYHHFEHKNKKSICINLYYILQKLYWHQASFFFDSHMEMYTHTHSMYLDVRLVWPVSVKKSL